MKNRAEIERQVILEFKETFAPEHAVRTLERIAKFCGEKETTYVKDSPTETAFREGQRSVILMVRHQLERDPNKARQKGAK